MARIHLFIFIVLFLTSCGDVIDVPSPDDSDPVFGTIPTICYELKAPGRAEM